MPLPELVQRLRRNGDIFLGIALAGSLLFRHWTITTVSVFLALLFVTSAFASIWHSIINFNWRLFRTSRGRYYNYKLIYTILVFPLILLHSDDLSGAETPLKSLLVTYIVVMNMDRFRWPPIVYGAIAGAIAALAFGLFQVGVADVARAGGEINPTQFGMIAMCMGSIAAVGFVHAKGDRLMAALSAIGFLCGTAAAFMSGARGALLALPLIVAFVAPIFWRRSRRAFLVVSSALVLFAGGLLVADVGAMSTRIVLAYSDVALLLNGDEASNAGAKVSRADGDRAKMLALAYRLFLENPVFGVGTYGWNEAAAKLALAPDSAEGLEMPYNQAHNQYADDLAKGGIVRLLLGLMLLGMPVYLFLGLHPFSDREGSPFALAGLVASSSFMVFCLSESLLLFSLPMMIHAIVMFYLLAACDAAAAVRAEHLPASLPPTA